VGPVPVAEAQPFSQASNMAGGSQPQERGPQPPPPCYVKAVKGTVYFSSSVLGHF